MIKVHDVLASKPPALFSLDPSQTVQAALELMRDRKVRAVIVTSAGRLVGIVAERDCALKVLLEGRNAADVTLASIMTREVVTVAPEDGLDHCMQLMATRSIRHLPVIRGETLVGMVSVGDIVKETIREQARHIHYLESYIKGHGVQYG
ncbi:MAG: CBS domain-containing protein [Burkholderiales bacterium]|jgi:CBS domain-containing protein